MGEGNVGPSPIIVRRARPDDRECIVGFQLQLAQETEGLVLERDTVRRGVQAVFDDPRKGKYWVAELHGRVVGSLLALPEWSDWRNGVVLWIHSLFVVPEARRRGVLRAFWRMLQSLVTERSDIRGLRLYVARGNETAQKAYRALGMNHRRYVLYEWIPEPRETSQCFTNRQGTD